MQNRVEFANMSQDQINQLLLNMLATQQQELQLLRKQTEKQAEIIAKQTEEINDLKAPRVSIAAAKTAIETFKDATLNPLLENMEKKKDEAIVPPSPFNLTDKNANTILNLSNLSQQNPNRATKEKVKEEEDIILLQDAFETMNKSILGLDDESSIISIATTKFGKPGKTGQDFAALKPLGKILELLLSCMLQINNFYTTAIHNVLDQVEVDAKNFTERLNQQNSQLKEKAQFDLKQQLTAIKKQIPWTEKALIGFIDNLINKATELYCASKNTYAFTAYEQLTAVLPKSKTAQPNLKTIQSSLKTIQSDSTSDSEQAVLKNIVEVTNQQIQHFLHPETSAQHKFQVKLSSQLTLLKSKFRGTANGFAELPSTASIAASNITGMLGQNIPFASLLLGSAMLAYEVQGNLQEHALKDRMVAIFSHVTVKGITTTFEKLPEVLSLLFSQQLEYLNNLPRKPFKLPATELFLRRLMLKIGNYFYQTDIKKMPIEPNALIADILHYVLKEEKTTIPLFSTVKQKLQKFEQEQLGRSTYLTPQQLLEDAHIINKAEPFSVRRHSGELGNNVDNIINLDVLKDSHSSILAAYQNRTTHDTPLPKLQKKQPQTTGFSQSTAKTRTNTKIEKQQLLKAYKQVLNQQPENARSEHAILLELKQYLNSSESPTSLSFNEIYQQLENKMPTGFFSNSTSYRNSLNFFKQAVETDNSAPQILSNLNLAQTMSGNKTILFKFATEMKALINPSCEPTKTHSQTTFN